MSADRDVTPIVRTWLRDGVTSLPEQVLDRVLDQVPAIRQERGWLVGRRNPAMQNALKLVIGAAAVIAVVVAGFNLVSPSDSGIGGPTATPSGSPTATPTPSATPTTNVEHITMQVAGSPVRLTVDKPTGWSGSDDPNEPDFVIDRGSTTPPNGMLVSLTAPTSTFEDPCQQVPVSPPVGPTVEDLVQALRDVPNHTTTELVSTTFGGLPATYLEMTTDDTLPCATREFYVYDGIYVQGPGQIARIWVFEVDGGRIVATALHYPEATDEMLAEEQLIIDSVQFE